MIETKPPSISDGPSVNSIEESEREVVEMLAGFRAKEKEMVLEVAGILEELAGKVKRELTGKKQVIMKLF
jgi:hypothetical protein